MISCLNLLYTPSWTLWLREQGPRSVQITINGETNASVIWRAVDLSQPLEADMDLVAAEEADE